jgi:ABC-type nickel/cobalt efflux system permease component RcnA
VNPRATDSKEANGRTRVHTTGENRHSPVATRQRPPTRRQGSGQCASADTQNVHSQTMRYLRACIGLLTALLLASVAHALTDGLTPGLVLGMALTTLLLLASLGLWRVGSRCERDDTEPPGTEH